MAGKLISDLNSGTLSLADAMEIDKDVSGTRTSFKTTVKDIVDFANHNVADEYDSTSTYVIGDYVMYESTLYKCTTAVSSAENFDSTKWTAVLVTDEMGSGGGGGTGGHTIIDENGNSMTARAGLQFVGANVDDDATNNKTIVNISGGGGGFGLVQSGHTVYTLTGQNLEDRVSITFDTPFPEVPNVALSLSDPSRGQYYNPQTGLGVMNLTKNGFDILIKSSSQAVAGDIVVYWIATTKFSGNGIFYPTIYSTEERIIGVWKDGRPLYQKTVDFGALPNNSTKTVSYNISDLDYFVKIQCVAHNQNGSRNIPFVDDAYKSGDVLLDTIKSSGVLRIIAHTDLSSLTGDVTLQYVKSTDTAGSGTWTPQGVPAVHYSTDEQIIGTWLGETFYQKTLHISNVQFDSTGVYDLNLTSMGTDILIADNSCSYYTFSTYVRNFEKLVPEDGHIYCYGVANRPIADGYITIKYTKSS